MNTKIWQKYFIEGLRLSAPYIYAHRGKTFILAFGGEAVEDARFSDLVHDIALLHSLGIRLVLAPGARPQIESRLKARGARLDYANGLRITDDAALSCVKEAAGMVRVEIEALLSMGLANTPMAGARIGTSSGNFVTARPLGIRDGIDYCHTGEVRRIDDSAIRQHLDAGRIVLLPPLGYSPTGEVFNISSEEVATAAATALQADKLILITEGHDPGGSRRRSISQLSLKQATALLNSRRKLSEDTVRHLEHAMHACHHGVRRTHLVSRHREGALLLELFTRDGNGTLVTAETYEGLRGAGIEDVGGIIELIKPLEDEGTLVKRSRELLEIEIDHFMVIERDGTIIACAALYPSEKETMAELACLAVHHEYRNEGRGDIMLKAIEEQAARTGIDALFVLTTRTAHWFRERGFVPGDLSHLPLRKKSLYNYQRKSRIYIKTIGPGGHNRRKRNPD
jgi:amino-acid N-acetyltransferase